MCFGGVPRRSASGSLLLCLFESSAFLSYILLSKQFSLKINPLLILSM